MNCREGCDSPEVRSGYCAQCLIALDGTKPTCSICISWQPDDSNSRSDGICNNPALSYEGQAPGNGLAVGDLMGLYGNIYTGRDFGCIHWMLNMAALEKQYKNRTAHKGEAMTPTERILAALTFDVPLAEVTEDMLSYMHGADDLSMFREKVLAAGEVQS